jgi:hypothetical protein
LVCTTGQSTVPAPKWTPIPLERIRGVYENQTLRDREIVDTLVRELDARVAVDPHAEDPSRERGRDYALLINLLANPHNKSRAAARTTNLTDALHLISQTSGSFQRPQEVRQLVAIAAAMAGANVAVDELEHGLDDPSMPREIRPLILRALRAKGTPIALVPRLITFLGDDWGYLDQSSDVVLGTPKQPTRIYPLRDEANASLAQLGIECDARFVDDPLSPGTRYRRYVLDEKSLCDKLSKWITGSNPLQAIEAVTAGGKINIPSVHHLLEGLAADTRLAPELRQAISSTLAQQNSNK